MLFNSADFLIFFPIVFLFYLVIPRRLRAVWLLLSSYYFYMCWNAAYILLIVFTTLITYAAALGIERVQGMSSSRAENADSARPDSSDNGGRTGPSAAKGSIPHNADSQGNAGPRGGWNSAPHSAAARGFLAAAILSNLILLLIFKYSDFAVDNLNGLLKLIHVQAVENPFDVILPVGISFYTFQTFSYVIDVYRGTAKAEHNLIYYALFASYFPQLVAGPIERSENLLRQLHELPSRPLVSLSKASSGFCMMLWGLFMKMVIADRISIFVDGVWDNLYACGTVETALAAFGFAVQIYCDFGGYSAIAIGVSRILGIELMENFNTPYFARSIADFWRRWHISLSSWMRDYIYIPLGGNRCSKLRRYCNLMITFLVSGLWHGASWTYVFWGFLHGLYQVIGDLLLPLRRRLYGAERSLRRPSLQSEEVIRTCASTAGAAQSPGDAIHPAASTQSPDGAIHPAASADTPGAALSSSGAADPQGAAGPADGFSADSPPRSTSQGEEIRPLITVNRTAFSYRLGQAAFTFVLTTFAWIFFRAQTMTDALYCLNRMFTRFNPWVLFNEGLYSFGLSEKEFGIFWAALVLLLAVDLLRYIKGKDLGAFLITQNLVFRWMVMLGLAAAVLIYGEYGITFSSAQFIYFAF